jgi:hypothetical protein
MATNITECQSERACKDVIISTLVWRTDETEKRNLLAQISLKENENPIKT